MPESELLSALKRELAFFESGGYGYPYRSVCRDSPLCLNAAFTTAKPCRECMMFALVPPEKRSSLLPCHHILLNEAGDTIAKLYETGSPEKLDRAFHDWLCATIQKLEKKEALPMKALEISTAISFKNILFLTDFTEASRAAQSYALALGRKYGALLYPAHVVEDFLVGELEAPVTSEILKNVEEQRHRDLDGLFKDSGLNYKELVAQGSIDALVPAWIAEHGIDVIVIGTHGRKGVDRFFLGSTAETIFRTATCPVLTVGPHVESTSAAEFKINKILFATSLTKEAEPAVAYALSFAHGRGAELTVLHVVANDIGVAPRFRRQDVQQRDLYVTEGNVTKKILEYANREQSDLIVLGLSKEQKTTTHFQRGIAYKVISLAPCAVLTVR